MAARALPSLATLSVRERRVLAIGGAIAAVLFLMAVVWPLERGVARAHRDVARKSAELTWMRSVAPELAAAGPRGRAPVSLPLIVLIDQSAHQAGLGASLAGSTPNGSGALSVQLQHVPFDSMVAWLARLQQQAGIEVTAARIEASGAPGLVNASLDLKRS